MPFKCSVYGCKGNYKSAEQKVSIFQFPEDSELRKIWTQRTMRKNFKPTKNSRICHLHFRKEDILWEYEFFDEKSGKMLKTKLQRPKLKERAVPIFLSEECSSFLHVTKRKKLDDALVRIAKEVDSEQQQLPDQACKSELAFSKEFSILEQILVKRACISEHVSSKYDQISENSPLSHFGEPLRINESHMHENTLKKLITVKQELPDDISCETWSSTALEPQNPIIVSVAPVLTTTALPTPIIKLSFPRSAESDEPKPSNIRCCARTKLLSNNIILNSAKSAKPDFYKESDDNLITEEQQLKDSDYNSDPSLLLNEGQGDPFHINRGKQSVTIKAADALTSMAEKNCLVLEKIARAIEIQAAESVKIATAIEIQATQSLKQTHLINQLINILSKK